MYVSELWFWLKISKCCKSLKIKFLLVFPCRHTTSFQCRYYVERLCTTSYRRWNDDVFIRSLSSIKLHTIGLFHYHLKISENQKSFDAFRRYRKWLVAWFFFLPKLQHIGSATFFYFRSRSKTAPQDAKVYANCC